MSTLSSLSKRPPIVTVVIPAYNAQEFIAYTIDSVIAQSYDYIDVLIVDDCSTDDTLKIINRYRAADRRIRVVRHHKNGGLSTSRNTGIIYALGDYICFLDADDYFFPTSVADRVEVLENLDKDLYAGAYSGSMKINENYFGIPSSPKPSVLYEKHYLNTDGMCPFNANQPIFFRDTLLQHGGFNRFYKQAEDWELWLRIMRNGYKFAPVQSIGCAYRSRQNSMIRNAPLDHLTNGFNLLDSIDEEDTNVYYNRRYSYYERQYNFTSRFVNFMGMGYPVEEQKLLELKEKMIPDITLRNFCGKQLKKSFFDGVCRLYNKPSTEIHNNQEINDHFTNTVYNSFKSNPRERKRQNKTYDFAFFLHVAYHVRNVIPVFKNLSLNYRGIFVDISVQYREGHVDETCKEYNLPVIPFNEYVLSNSLATCNITMCDWDAVVQPYFKYLIKQNIQTVSLVEGVQDYFDADTGRKRNAYGLSENVILPGEFDLRYFRNSSQKVFIGGLPRLTSLFPKRKKKFQGMAALINLNFTYNVLTECRDEWLDSVLNACEQASFPSFISKHHAERELDSSYNVIDQPLYKLFDQCNVIISRFSTVILEAIAAGIEAIYYNPHGEKVDKFQVDIVGFYSASNEEELSKILGDIKTGSTQPPRAHKQFLKLHCNYDGESESKYIQKISVIFEEIFSQSNKLTEDAPTLFYQNYRYRYGTYYYEIADCLDKNFSKLEEIRNDILLIAPKAPFYRSEKFILNFDKIRTKDGKSIVSLWIYPISQSITEFKILLRQNDKVFFPVKSNLKRSNFPVECSIQLQTSGYHFHSIQSLKEDLEVLIQSNDDNIVIPASIRGGEVTLGSLPLISPTTHSISRFSHFLFEKHLVGNSFALITTKNQVPAYISLSGSQPEYLQYQRHSPSHGYSFSIPQISKHFLHLHIYNNEKDKIDEIYIMRNNLTIAN